MPRQAGAKRDDEYLTTGEAAQLLGVSPKTVSRWADQGRIVYLVTIGGHRRFARSVIEQTRVSMGHDPG
jgi:excisionase family DNA binding protein